MLRMRKLFLATTMCVLLALTLNADEWPHYAADTARTSTPTRATRDLNTIRWSATPDAAEQYVARSSPVVYGGRVFVNARHYDSNSVQDATLVIAYDIFDGSRRWTTPIDVDVWDSWSSPAVDIRNQTVLLGSGFQLFALDMNTGDIVWQTQLEREVVNASPAVSTDLSNDGTPANRAFITDYSGFGDSARLYAINVDPFEPANNPYQPGETVWTAELPGASGNTPAYDSGVVYVASKGGQIKALDGLDGTLVWETQVDLSGYPQYAGFYGGLCVRNGYIYAAIYVFYGGQNNSALYKLDAADGDVVWDTPCERTESIPIVTDDGRIYLSGGIDGYGSAVKIQAFEDNGDSAALVWDTYQDTDGELIVGGWTHQPACARGYLYAGTPDETAFFARYTDLYILDTSKTPGDPDFIVAHHAGSGGSPAVADGTLYSFGQDGLFAFDPSPACLADLDGDGIVGLADLATLLGAYGTSREDENFDSDADLNRDGTVDLNDLATLLGTYGAECP